MPILFRADEVELRADLPEWVSRKVEGIRKVLENVGLGLGLDSCSRSCSGID